jgi:hypothetical protein
MFPRELLECRLQSNRAVAEQDHQLRGAKFFERKCCLLVPCQHTQKKTGGGAYYFLQNEPISNIQYPISNIAAFCLYLYMYLYPV